MSYIITSSYTEDAHTQAGGGRYVTERHTDDRGRTYEFTYLLPTTTTAQAVMAARAERLEAQITEQREAEALVSGTLLPLSQLKMRELFTMPERMAIDAFRAGLEAIPEAQMPAATKAALRTGFIDYDKAEYIARPFDERVHMMLDLFVSLGLLTVERRTAIVEAGNG